MFLSIRDRETGNSGWMNAAKYRIILKKTSSRAHTNSDWGDSSHFNTTMTRNIQYRQNSTGVASEQVSEYPRMVQTKPRLNPIEHLRRNLKNTVHRHSPSRVTEPERICPEEWDKLLRSRCEKLVVMCARRCVTVITAKEASIEYGIKGLNTNVNKIFNFLVFKNLSKEVST